MSGIALQHTVATKLLYGYFETWKFWRFAYEFTVHMYVLMCSPDGTNQEVGSLGGGRIGIWVESCKN